MVGDIHNREMTHKQTSSISVKYYPSMFYVFFLMHFIVLSCQLHWPQTAETIFVLFNCALTFTGKQDGTLENNQNKGDFQDWVQIDLLTRWSHYTGYFQNEILHTAQYILYTAYYFFPQSFMWNSVTISISNRSMLLYIIVTLSSSLAVMVCKSMYFALWIIL